MTTEEGYAFLLRAGPEAISEQVFDSLFESYGYPAGTVPFQSLIGVNDDGTLFTGGNFVPGSVVNFRGETDPLLFNDRRYTYNFATPNALQMPLERTSLFTRATFDVSPSARLFAEALWADYSVSQQLAPAPVDFVFMPPGNPFLSADLVTLVESRPDPDVPFFWFKRFSEPGPRVQEVDYDTLQVTAGFEADVMDWWRLDGHVQYGASDQDQRQSGNAPGFIGGNPELDPEDADTYTVGLAWTPDRLPDGLGRFQASLDWYRIEVADAIEFVSGVEVLALCFDPGTNPGYSAGNEWCRRFGRDPATGEIENLYEINRNIGGRKLAGIDLQLDWRRDLGPGELGLNWLVSWLDTYEYTAGAGAPSEERAGTTSKTGGFPLPGGSLPEWKWTLAATYAYRGLDLTARWRYVDSMEDGQFPDFEVPSRDYVDLYARYAFGSEGLDGLSVGLGVENVTDADPPIYPSYVQANTDPSQYDVLGRRYFFRLSYAF